jgi:hypothetical protein
MGVKCSKDAGAVSMSAARPFLAAATTTADDESTSDDCGLFLQMNDDVILTVLSYVSYSPFERDVVGTLTLEAINNPELKPPQDDEVQRLVKDYNAVAERVNKKVLKHRKRTIFPFWAPQEYYQEGRPGSKCVSLLVWYIDSCVATCQ